LLLLVEVGVQVLRAGHVAARPPSTAVVVVDVERRRAEPCRDVRDRELWNAVHPESLAGRLVSGLRAAGRLLAAATVTGPVGPAIARLAGRAIVEVDEPAGRVDPQAHAARVE